MVQLRYYQADVIARARQRIAEGARRVIIQGATGSGKSHVAAEVIRCAAAKGSRVLFLVHRRRLVQQISERLVQFGVRHGVIMAGVRPTGALVQVASRDTLLSRTVENGWWRFPPAELVVIDECHNFRVSGSDELSGYEAIVQAYPRAVILGLTATPARSSGHGLGAFFQALECTVPTSQLVREGYLVPVKCFAPERMGKARKRGKAVKGLAGDPVTWWQRLAQGRPTVVFASKVTQSQALVQQFCAAGIRAAHIDANTPDEERDATVKSIQDGSVKVVSNVGVMVEGVDVPELSCCVLLRMAGSYVLYAQAVGRVMRSHPSKTDAVLIDHAGACHVHGLPDDDVEWTLDDADTVDRRNKEANLDPEEKRPIVCPVCALIFRGLIKCPRCGHVLPRKNKPVEVRDELLTEVQRGQDAIVSEEARERYWLSALHIAKAQGGTLAKARCIFKNKFKMWPPDRPPFNKLGPNWKRPVSELMAEYSASEGEGNGDA